MKGLAQPYCLLLGEGLLWSWSIFQKDSHFSFCLFKKLFEVNFYLTTLNLLCCNSYIYIYLHLNISITRYALKYRRKILVCQGSRNNWHLLQATFALPLWPWATLTVTACLGYCEMEIIFNVWAASWGLINLFQLLSILKEHMEHVHVACHWSALILAIVAIFTVDIAMHEAWPVE